jgi:hypothetical protein
MSDLINYRIYKVDGISVVECHNNVTDNTDTRKPQPVKQKIKPKAKLDSNWIIDFKVNK